MIIFWPIAGLVRTLFFVVFRGCCSCVGLVLCCVYFRLCLCVTFVVRVVCHLVLCCVLKLCWFACRLLCFVCLCWGWCRLFCTLLFRVTV